MAKDTPRTEKQESEGYIQADSSLDVFVPLLEFAWLAVVAPVHPWDGDDLHSPSTSSFFMFLSLICCTVGTQRIVPQKCLQTAFITPPFEPECFSGSRCWFVNHRHFFICVWVKRLGCRTCSGVMSIWVSKWPSWPVWRSVCEQGIQMGWRCLVIVFFFTKAARSASLLIRKCVKMPSKYTHTHTLMLCLMYTSYHTRMLTHTGTTDGQPLILYITLGQMFVCVVISDHSIQ